MKYNKKVRNNTETPRFAALLIAVCRLNSTFGTSDIVETSVCQLIREANAARLEPADRVEQNKKRTKC